MKILIIIFFNLIISIFSVLPIWDFKKSSKDLLGTDNSCSYTISNRGMYAMSASLEKKITRNNENITHTNYLKIENVDKGAVKFENIESFYKEHESNIIKIFCPKDNFNPLKLDDLSEITFTGWIKKNNFDLKCYFHKSGHFLIFYLRNGQNQVKIRKSGHEEWTNPASLQFFDEIYDFRLENDSPRDGKYPFLALIKENNYIELLGAKINFANSDGISRENENKINLTMAKNFTQGYFNNASTHF